MPPISFVPEVDHASVVFEDLAVEGAALLPGDGYTDYVKPFRTVEDCHVSLAVTAYLLRVSLRAGAPAPLVEESLACIAAHAGLATLDPASPATHLVLAGTRGLLHRLIPALEQRWREADPRCVVSAVVGVGVLDVAGAAAGDAVVGAVVPPQPASSIASSIVLMVRRSFIDSSCLSPT